MSGGRLFVGVFPPAGALSHLDAALTAIRPGLRRWQPAERWHVTLVFLGDVAPQRLAGLSAALEDVCGTAQPLSLRLAGAGTFGTGRGAAVLWVGVEGEGLAEFAAQVARAVLPEADDQPFRAHLTLARWRPPERPDPAVARTLRSYRGPPWPVEEVVLVRSHLGPRPRYERIAGWTPGGP